MLPGNTRKMDKSTILQKSIDYLHKHKGEASKILFCLFVCLFGRKPGKRFVLTCT